MELGRHVVLVKNEAFVVLQDVQAADLVSCLIGLVVVLKYFVLVQPPFPFLWNSFPAAAAAALLIDFDVVAWME